VFSFRDWSTGQDDKDLERLEKRRAAQRRYRETHREEIRAAARRYHESHKDERNESARLKWRTNPDFREKRRVQNRLWQRKNVLKKVYGISMADYEAMFERQGGACAICKRTGVTLCVDHCHWWQHAVARGGGWWIGRPVAATSAFTEKSGARAATGRSSRAIRSE